ncbi:MAG: hypothetical protein ACYC35_18825 [Pirellulales bacterium]
MNQHRFTAIMFVVVAFGVCGVAHANSIAPYVWFWPGIVSITLVYAFPASVLAAFLERPFLTAAGLNRRALVLSLRANFVSAVVGILLVPVGYPALYAIGPLWCLAAFGVSCAVELAYLRRFFPRLAWGWVVGGNAVSSIVLMALPPITLAIKEHYARLAWSLEPHETWLNCVCLVGSLALFLTSFACPVRRDMEQETATSGAASVADAPEMPSREQALAAGTQMGAQGQGT